MGAPGDFWVKAASHEHLPRSRDSSSLFLGLSFPPVKPVDVSGVSFQCRLRWCLSRLQEVLRAQVALVRVLGHFHSVALGVPVPCSPPPVCHVSMS